MIEQLRNKASHWVVALGIVIIGLSAGCQSGPKFSELPPATGNMLHVGDVVTVTAIPLSGDKGLIPDHTERIGEDGTINLLYIGPVTAVGKTASELQKEIHDLYVPKYYRELNVTVKGETRYFYVDGEVFQRGAKEYPGDMTVVKAISVAGGFTDFAKKTKVRLTRGGHSEIINVEKAIRDPRYDVPVFPGDKIYVPRRLF
jgi:protein involved in polysaccharide export with SLBB domain